MYRLVTQDTVEEKIVERAAKKMQIDNLVIQKGKFNQARASNAPTKDEVSQIIRFGAQEVVIVDVPMSRAMLCRCSSHHKDSKRLTSTLY